jgi:hypothetical protein
MRKEKRRCLIVEKKKGEGKRSEEVNEEIR